MAVNSTSSSRSSILGESGHRRPIPFARRRADAQLPPAGVAQFPEGLQVALVDRCGVGKAATARSRLASRSRCRVGKGERLVQLVMSSARCRQTRSPGENWRPAARPPAAASAARPRRDRESARNQRSRRARQGWISSVVSTSSGAPPAAPAIRARDRRAVSRHPRIAHHVAHLPLAMNALGKGTEVEADHRPLQPAARGGDDLVVAGLGLLDGHGPVIRRLAVGSDARQCSD
jgi:hypothetical protein